MATGRRICSFTFGALVLALAAIGETRAQAPAEAPQLAALPAESATSCTDCGFDAQQDPLELDPRFRENHSNFTPHQTDQERTCKACHSGVTEASHPTGFRPGRSLPPEFPLNAQGEMTCTTCHAVEADGRTRKKPEEPTRAFCTSCHTPSFFAEMTDGGSSILMSGHLSVDTRPLDTVDNYSMQCATCHTDNLAITGARVASIGFTPPGRSAANHPIGSLYRDVAMRHDFQPAGTLPAEILLPAGRVSCLSCHKAYTRKHGELTVARDLCAQCHNL